MSCLLWMSQDLMTYHSFSVTQPRNSIFLDKGSLKEISLASSPVDGKY